MQQPPPHKMFHKKSRIVRFFRDKNGGKGVKWGGRKVEGGGKKNLFQSL